jgi:NAD(P)-dependent dehydrogenase (short-subunit alcohol dehydrogenase family)
METSKVWLVTEAARGLGMMVAKKILNRGDRLVATARSTIDLEPLIANFGRAIHPVAVDLRNANEVKAAIHMAVERFGKLDVLVSNADHGAHDSFASMTAEDFKEHVDTNFWGFVHTTRFALRIMRTQGFGYILQITSANGIPGTLDFADYYGVRSAIERMSEELAVELSSSGITIRVLETNSRIMNMTAAPDDSDELVDCHNRSARRFRSSMRTIYSVPENSEEVSLAILALMEGNSNPPFTSASTE